ncbi:surface polysaccharide O-acyltransferase-like enzyme [Elusimicrobium posterum]|uniref:acyltransferase n=1 Tax=Elusimicrobium posterum TaxID=3116653 RepID=UPI003C793554
MKNLITPSITQDNKRILWLDILRVLSAFAIVVIHTSTNIIDTLAFGSPNWFSADVYLAAARYAVPVFVMISGVFFLNPDKNITIGNIYRKYIFRMLTVLFFWALVRTLVIDAGFNSVPASGWAKSFFISIKMFWFLPMIIGLYIVTPFIRPLVKDKKLLQYFMEASFILALCVPVMQAVETQFLPGASFLTDVMTLIKIPFFIFGAHFVFGYYAYNYDLSKKTKYILYASAVISVILMSAGTYWFYEDKASRFFFYSMHGASLSPLAFLAGAGVFVFCKDVLGKVKFSARMSALIHKLAAYSLGVYLSHIIIVEVLARYGVFKRLDFVSLFIIPLTAGVIFLLANALIALIYKIKFVRKYFL